MGEKHFIYGSMADRRNRTECVSHGDVMAKFREIVRVYRQRGNTVDEAGDLKWVIHQPGGKTDSLWIEDENGQVIKAVDVDTSK